jgi:hypothetical protein
MIEGIFMVCKNYIKKFWVGLMDGDGSIQVNHWREKSLQYRIVIKLKYTEQNYVLLLKIKEDIGGRIQINKNKEVLWVVDSRKKIIEIIKIFDRYPPLTFRLRSQLRFLKECLFHNNVDFYIEKRALKYEINEIKDEDIPEFNPDYFNEWLSGFIEAEACFCMRESNNNSFSLGQNDDKVLIEHIRKFFEIKSSIRIIKQRFFFFETYRLSSLENIIKHLLNYPLLGEKLLSFNRFKSHINTKVSCSLATMK